MKTFLVEHNGLYLGGLSIVSAETREEARKLIRPVIREEMKSLGLSGRIHMSMKEIDTKKENAFLVTNGDY